MYYSDREDIDNYENTPNQWSLTNGTILFIYLLHGRKKSQY